MIPTLEKILELMNRYGFPFIAGALFLVAAIAAIRGLWKEYRRLSDRHHELLSETARMLELNAFEAEVAGCAIQAALERLAEIKNILSEMHDAINDPEHRLKTGDR